MGEFHIKQGLLGRLLARDWIEKLVGLSLFGGIPLGLVAGALWLSYQSDFGDWLLSHFDQLFHGLVALGIVRGLFGAGAALMLKRVIPQLTKGMESQLDRVKAAQVFESTAGGKQRAARAIIEAEGTSHFKAMMDLLGSVLFLALLFGCLVATLWSALDGVGESVPFFGSLGVNNLLIGFVLGLAAVLMSYKLERLLSPKSLVVATLIVACFMAAPAGLLVYWAIGSIPSFLLRGAPAPASFLVF